MGFATNFLKHLGPSFLNEFSPLVVPAAGRLASSALSLFTGTCLNNDQKSAVTSRILGGAVLNAWSEPTVEKADMSKPNMRRSSRTFTPRSPKQGLTTTQERREIATKMLMVRKVRVISNLLTTAMTGTLVAALVGSLSIGTGGIIGLAIGIAYTLGMFISSYSLSDHYMMSRNTTEPSHSENTDRVDLDSPLNKSNNQNKWNFLGSSLIWPLALMTMVDQESDFESLMNQIHN